MDETDISKISIDEIMARIREEAQQQNKKFPFSPCPSFSSHTIIPAAHPLPHKEFYALSDFLGYHDSDFIDNAYSSILCRLPDSGGEFYLSRLQKGELTKVDIVGRLRYSREGRSKKVHVKGLLLPFMLQSFFKIPVLGWGLRIVTGLLNLPVILKNIQVIENAAFTQIRLVKEESEKRLSHITVLQEEISRAQSAQKSELKEAVSALSNESAELSRQIKGHKLTTLDMQRRLRLLLEEARKRLPEPISIEQIGNMVKEEDHLLDAMYVDFENKFRGTREEIKKRVKVYLPYVEDVLKAANDALVLDIGCGRGEWLELLKENDIPARGLDLNRIMVAQCRDLGLDVMESDALNHLRSLKNNTLSVVTGFHIVEHLPFQTLITLFDESLRVLKPGGICIFETPNPENLLVGACTFYVDPSHIKPIPPQTLSYLIEARGFVNVEIMRLNPNSSIHIEDPFLNDQFAVGQDYSIIGFKA